ncbi:hypothetical protein DH20_06745 [Pantoea agglomerans]|nr:hypothetical protein [Pantoea agglomerans]
MDIVFLSLILASLAIPHISPFIFKSKQGKSFMHTQLLSETLKELAQVDMEIERFCTMLRATPIEQVNTLAWIRESLTIYKDAQDELKGRVSLLSANSINLH